MKTEMTKLIDAALNLYNLEARKRESDVHDGGCSGMLNQIKSYNCGRNGQIPDWLAPYFAEVTKAQDPEYNEYLRLQKKFKN
jgi:hypothetical protein